MNEPVSVMTSVFKTASEDTKAGAKSAGKKMRDADRTLDTEYDKEKVKQSKYWTWYCLASSPKNFLSGPDPPNKSEVNRINIL
jgi:hypothetical protein